MLEDFRNHFFNVWMPERSVEYFHTRDPKALPHLRRMFELPENASVDDETAKKKFDAIYSKLTGLDAAKPPDALL